MPKSLSQSCSKLFELKKKKQTVKEIMFQKTLKYYFDEKDNSLAEATFKECLFFKVPK